MNKTYIIFQLISIFLFTQSCSKIAGKQLNINKDSTKNSPSLIPTIPIGNSNPVDSNYMQFEIIFENNPSDVQINTAPVKYNKNGWLSGEWDDNSVDAMKAFQILKDFYYTDGCGNKINYAFAVAVNGRNGYHNGELGLEKGIVNYDSMKFLINNGWDIENHSYYHGPDANYNFGYDWYKNISELDKLIYDRIKYKMNGAVVPTNYDNFPTAAKKFGYLFSTSQGTFDGMSPGATPHWGAGYENFDWAPKDFSCFGRCFYDNWNELEKEFIIWSDGSFKNYNSYFRIASHTIDEVIFRRMMRYFYDNSKDKFAILPTREMMEYRIMASQPRTQQLTNNKLLIKIDISKVPERFKWRDMSFLIKADARIAEVKNLGNINRISFNKDIGLINIFNNKIVW